MAEGEFAEFIVNAKNTFEAIKLGASIIREAKGAVSDPDQRQLLESAFQDAEKARQAAEAQLGMAFGYQLCRCTLPPQVCLRIGYDKRSGAEKSRCPKCNTVYPVKLEPLSGNRPHY